jgi:hypothetical protein
VGFTAHIIKSKNLNNMKRIEKLENPFYLDLTDYGEWMICQGLYPNIIKYKVGGDKDMALKLIDKINDFAKNNKGCFPIIIQQTHHSIAITYKVTIKERLRVLLKNIRKKFA